MRWILLVVWIVLFIAVPPVCAQTDQRKRVAVFPFEFGSVYKWWQDATWDIGKGVSDLVVAELDTVTFWVRKTSFSWLC